LIKEYNFSCFNNDEILKERDKCLLVLQKYIVNNFIGEITIENDKNSENLTKGI